jgi:hypothetical protein
LGKGEEKGSFGVGLRNEKSSRQADQKMEQIIDEY